MRTATILGAGELGTACACALAASRSVDSVTLLTRDASMAAPAKTTATSPSHSSDLENASGAGGSSTGASSSPAAASNNAATAWPSVVHLQDLKKFYRDAASETNCKRAQHPLFLCTPCASYLPSHDAWARAALGNEHCSATHDVLTRWRSSSGTVDSSKSEGASSTRFAVVFTRGFAANGAVPAQLADVLLNGPIAEHDSSAGSDPLAEGETPVLVASGPVLAKEWSLQSTPLALRGASAALSSPIPSRPPSALSAIAAADGDGSETRRRATPPSVSGMELPHAFSGVALAFAVWTPSVAADTGRQEALAEKLRRFFPRESITYLSAHDAAAILAIVNGCVPLCSFGAGLVSSVYTGTSVTSLAAYAQHAVSATEQLVNKLLGRACGTPLPLPAVSTLWCACTCLVSREFALGRKLDFYFRKQDATEAIFRGHEHHLFAATVDGLHERMQASGVASPFYEVLMDTYNTMIRASRTGEGLVKEGFYGYRDTLGEDCGELLRQVTRVDEAMLSGDEARFTEAKERIMKVFSGATF